VIKIESVAVAIGYPSTQRFVIKARCPELHW